MFDTWNYLILIVYMLVLVAVGLRFSGRQKSTEDYFLGGRSLPWLAVGMSMFASITSASSFIGIPGVAYRENIALIVLGFTSPVVVPFLVYIFYPFYRNLGVTTTYEYIDRRYGRPARYTVSGLFCLARLGWLGVVIYSPSLALSVVTGMNLSLCILLIGSIATAYAMLGGISAVIWTDVLQFIMLVGGAIWVGVSLVQEVPGGYSGIMEIASSTSRLDIWEGGLDPFQMTGIAVVISYFFQLMQDYGTDQVAVQRLLTIKDLKGMAKAAFFNSLSDLFIVVLLLFVGTGLFAYFHTFPERLSADVSGDQILPYYIVHALPTGVSGLLLAAIFAAAMSSVDSGVNSLATVIVNDFVKPRRRQAVADQKDLKLARILTAAIGGFALITAFYAVTVGQVLKASQAFLGMFAAPILALFMLGMLTRRTHFRGWLVGLVLAVAASVWVQNFTAVHFIYYFPFCFGICAGVGYLASVVMSGPRPDPELVLWGRGKTVAVSRDSTPQS